MQRTDASAVLQIFTESDVWSSLDEWECQCVQKEVTFRHMNVCVQDQYVFHLCNFANIKHQIFLPFIRITAHYSISWTPWYEEGEKLCYFSFLTFLQVSHVSPNAFICRYIHISAETAMAEDKEIIKRLSFVPNICYSWWIKKVWSKYFAYLIFRLIRVGRLTHARTCRW